MRVVSKVACLFKGHAYEEFNYSVEHVEICSRCGKLKHEKEKNLYNELRRGARR